MYYSFDITAPANTAKTSPVITELKLTAGVIQRVEIQFPAGSLALIHCQIFRGNQQLWPTNPESDFSSDDYVIPIDEYYELDDEPYNLTVKTWNLSTRLPHMITVRIGIIRPEDVEKSSGIASALKSLLRLIGIKV